MKLIEARNIVAERLTTRVLDDVSFNIGAGEIVGVVGPKRAGKTTLLRTLLGLQLLAAGEVLFDGEMLSQIPHRQFAKAVGYLPQGALFHWPITVERAVSLGRFPHRGPLVRRTPEDSRAIDRAMEIAGIMNFADRRVDQISGGERMRVHLARLLAGEHRVIIADEPTTSLDPKYQLHFLSVLEQQAAQGSTIVISLHDLSLAARFCNRLIVLENGAVAVVDTPEQALTDTTLATVFGVIAERIHTAAGTSIIPTQLYSAMDPSTDR